MKKWVLLFVFAFSNFTWATDLHITVENLQPAGGFFFTPVWAGFHDGSFDVFSAGEMASPELIAIAEGGDVAPLQTLFAGNGVDTVVAPGSPFGPMSSSFASSASAMVTVNPMMDRYFSYTSMIIPSNDAFIGNDNSMAYEIFNADGSFKGPLTIEVFANQIWDAGSEVNSVTGGAAFSANGGDSVDEALGIALHAGLNDFVGSGTANGEMISTALAANAPIARLTINQVPEPNSGVLALSAGLGLLMLRRRRR
ncbi:MAG: spondin domain-containing protein [Pirellulaceae bacterium]